MSKKKTETKTRKMGPTVGDVVQGKKILEIERHTSGARGCTYRYAVFQCDCETEFRWNMQNLSVKRIGKMTLLCSACRQKAKLTKDCGGTDERPTAVNTRLSNATLRLVQSLPQKELEKAEGLVRAHLHQCLASGSAIAPLEQVWREAVELARMDDRLPETEWTRENRRDGIKIQRYGQYFGGIGAI
jgi:hypothetical protein